MKPSTSKFRGILNAEAAEANFRLYRHSPADDLASFIERYWIIRWDLRELGPHQQETLPNPCVNLVLEKGRSAVYGVFTGRFTRRLDNRGQALGVKFRPGGFHPFFKMPVARLTNTRLKLEDALGVESDPLENEILALDNREAMVAIVEALLRSLCPQPDANVTLINQAIDLIMSDAGITKVEDLAEACNINLRSLQRLFNRYVGVGPKWVIGRYRIQEAVAQLHDSLNIDWAGLAVSLGYFDQAHFAKDFKALIGKTPMEYVLGRGTGDADGLVSASYDTE